MDRNERPLNADAVIYVSGAPTTWLVEGLAPLRRHAELVVDDRIETLRAVIDRVEVVYAWPNARGLLEPLWPQARRLRWIHHSGAGVDHLLFPDLVASDVVLTNSQGIYSDAVAEYAVALMLALAKRLPEVVVDQRARLWIHRETETLGGRTLGVVGLGSIGRAVARRARGLGMTVVGTRQTVGSAPAGVARVYAPGQLEEMLARCDYVALTVPHTPATTGLIGERALHAMRPTAFLVNVARGEVVDEAALRRALTEGWIAGAASDVFRDEPLAPTSPWYDAPRLLISPHMAPNARGWQGRAIALFLDNVERYLAGRRLRNVVRMGRGY
jgi:phosphoglycerate dehydrogenase-like enzyme